LLLQKRLVPYCQRINKTFLVDVTRTDLANFRGTWPMADNARLKTQELLKAFWRYCVEQHWIPESPARTLSKIKPTIVQVQPFSHAEMEEILAACDRYPTTNSFGVDNRAVITAFVLLLRWSGLRISDAVVLLWKNVQDGVLNVKCQKNGAHVTFRLNPVVLDALARIRRDGSPYIFYKGIGSPRDAKGKIKKGVAHSWQRSLRTLFALTTIGPDHDDVNGDSEAGHAHRFRHTFAVEWLMANPPIPIESVAQMLGDTLKTTSDTYNAWTNARHHQLGAAMAKHWAAVSPSGAPVAASAPASTRRLPPVSS
jgi:integrase